MLFKWLFKNTFLIHVLLLIVSLSSCKAQNEKGKSKISVGANKTEQYLPLLTKKSIGIVANQTSVIFKENGHVHLVDSLLDLNITVKRVFSPEHGFRGKADAAEKVHNSIDVKTGLPIISLYGKHKKPQPKDLKGLDLLVFDIQDVGVRFYTYISTLHYVMEACAENNISLIVMDRPNPNGHYIDGPTLEPKYSSFVGKHPVPLVYGMTIGEYAQMINGEKWLKNGIQCNLTVIPLTNYTHQSFYSLPIAPSPNLPNDKAINLYPSLGFFEGTPINAGRGTSFQFQRYGSSKFPKSNFNYIPKPNYGSKYPKDQNKICYGINLDSIQKLSQINIDWLVDAFDKYPNKENFFGKTFTIHAGNKLLENQLRNKTTALEIKKSWKEKIDQFKNTRRKYLLYQ
ncbi:exo-beta-N-acetylmuramidase NamZ family protein [Wenyingzhuangia sp. IMCC45574]